MRKIGIYLFIILLFGCSAPAVNAPKVIHQAGSASVTNMKFENASAEKAGSIQFNTTIAGVVLDENDQVIYVSIDTAQNKGFFHQDGQVEENESIASKKLLKEDYDMKKASAIQKEWYEQIAWLEEWMIGKNMDEIKNLSLDEMGYPADSDVKSGCTMNVKDYLKAVEKAVSKSVPVEKAASYGFANITELKSTAASESLGSIQSNTTFALTGFSEDKKIQSVLIDTDQNATSFNSAGGIEQSEIKLSKKLLKEDYGMKKVSAIQKEWYEQIASLEEWMIGKTIEEVNQLSLSEDKIPLDTDITASVTMKVAGYLEAVEQSAENAK